MQLKLSNRGEVILSRKTIETIKILGKMRNEDLKEIGRNSGVGENAIYRWEKHEPKISTLKKVADYLGVDYKILLP